MMNRPLSTALRSPSSSGMPLPGSHPSLYQKTKRKSRPSQNTGAETPMSAKIMPARSNHDRRLIAEMMPIGIPIASQTTAAPNARTRVTGTRSLITSQTGALFP
jgi:hypothetical protein